MIMIRVEHRSARRAADPSTARFLTWHAWRRSGMLVRVTTPQNLDERFRDAVSALPTPDSRRSADDAVHEGTALTGARALELFDAQLASRHLDLAARWLRSFNEGFYTIGSSGHEGNAAVAAALLPTDPALLHYRSAAFFCARAKSVPD